MIVEKLWPTFYRVSRSTTFRLSLLSASILALGVGVFASEPPKSSCKQRAEAYRSRVTQLKKDAHEKLRIGTREDAVNEFFEAHGLPFNVFRSGNHKEGDAASLTDAQRAELDYRITRHEQNPSDAIPWEQVRAGLFKKP